MVKTLSHLALNPYRVVTDGRIDRIPIANTRSEQYLPVQLWRVKISQFFYSYSEDHKPIRKNECCWC